jgi:hypothetical protein
VIVRILGEGQYDVADGDLAGLNELDTALERAVEGDDVDAFTGALSALLDGVRRVGRAHPEDSLDESDVILPPADASLAEVRELLDEGGLIPG